MNPRSICTGVTRRVRPGHPRHLLVHRLLGVHPTGQHEPMALQENESLWTARILTYARFSLSHVSLAPACPYPSPDNCPHPYAQRRPIDEETIAGMRRSILLLISSSIAAPNELPTPFSKSRAMLKSASFFRGYETEAAERRG